MEKKVRIFGNAYMGKIAGSEKERMKRIVEQGRRVLLKLKSTDGQVNQTRTRYANTRVFMLFTRGGFVQRSGLMSNVLSVSLSSVYSNEDTSLKRTSDEVNTPTTCALF